MDQVKNISTADLKRIQGGRNLADAPPGEKIVISGISGYFPNSNNVQHFMENLFNKIDLCDDDERRFTHKNINIPKLSGKMNNVDKFDSGYFGVPELQVICMDPMHRMLLERAIEALMDAGINPEELKGTNTGVYVGTSIGESENVFFYSNLLPQTYPITGCTKSMLAHRLSYALQLNGPSVSCDTACSSGLYAFELAYRSIREGKCNMAIAAACHMCIDPNATLQFARLGVLNMNTGCRPFDRDAGGYTRSEAVVVIVLQKEKHSRRVYAKVVHSKVNIDGFKEQGITFPSSEGQLQLLKDVYEECNVDPKSIAYVEAHGTGTTIGDPEELSAIDTFFCTNRDKPLLIGSIKGNIGHTEPASGLCSVIKVLFGMNFEHIPPNIHYDNPRPDIPALMEKRVTVITETTKWPECSGLAGINCFGFGGANCHVILEKFTKKKEIREDNIPRLVCFSGRTKDSLKTIQDYLSTHDLDYEFIRLFQEIFSKDFKDHIYRGYSIILPNKEVKRSSCLYKKKKYTLYLCLGNESSHSCSLLEELQQLTPFRETYQRCLNVLDINGIQMQFKQDEPNNVIQKTLVNMIVQLGIINIFKALNITFDYVRGCSIGEFAATYANGVLKLDESIMACYITSKHYQELKSNANDLQKLLKDLTSVIPEKFVIQSANNNYEYGSLKHLLFNILNPNLTSTTCPDFEANAIVVNVDFKCNFNKAMIQLELFKQDRNVVQFLRCVGSLYELGFMPRVDKLFPEIKWPVSSGTALLSPLIKWNHSKNYAIPRKHDICKVQENEKQFKIRIMGTDCSFYKGHVIDGRNLFPATGYIYLVWNLFSNIIGEPQEDLILGFENVKFLRATTFAKDGVIFDVIINKDGYFEIADGDEPVASGRVCVSEKFNDIPKPCEMDEGMIALSQNDIYKELRIRGYQYKGIFKAQQQMNKNEVMIKWSSNWITFLDNMLQICITKDDFRCLAVPTGIDRLVIDPESFLKYVETLDADKLVPCYVNKAIKSVYTKSVQIIGLQTNTISRKRQIHQPVLESYEFVPNNLTTNVSVSTRVNMQIVLENKEVINMKILEVINEESDTLQPLSSEIVKVLEDLPLIQPNIMVFTKRDLSIEIKGIQLETGKVTYDRSNVIYIASNLLQNAKEMQFAMSAIMDDGFIITVENMKYSFTTNGLNILTEHKINSKFIYLLMKVKQQQISKVVDVSNLENMENWLNTLKINFANSNRVILYAQNNNVSGILGLTNCIRREQNGTNVSCFFIRENAPNFDESNDFYKSQIGKGMSINIYQDGKWGTYRHLACNPNAKVECAHFYGSTRIRGDLSSFDWFQGKLSTKYDNICHVYYSALNFRDVMLASGKLSVTAINISRMEQECVEGFEFSGRDSDGNRIMGIARCGSNSNLVQSSSTWRIPSDWSLEDAATVPVVYLTVLKAFTEANIKRGQSVLIHSGTGGIGQAALNICQYYKCNIFTTVGTYEKKKYLMKHYPHIKTSQIGNSRSTNFEELILCETNGRGVDIVLNSLSEDKLRASVRSLAKGGYFLEIGKFDLSNNTRISTDFLKRSCTYQAIMLTVGDKDDNLNALFQLMMDKSYIKPLNRKVFLKDELENAFRYMMTGNHIGKVIIKIRDEENEIIAHPAEISYYAIPKFYCDPNLAYLILGGLGGFGLELADWLMLRGAKTLVLSSRKGVVTGYQQSRIRHWCDNGVKTLILLDDITTFEGCKNLINKANSAAPIGAIFNLAVELRDDFLNNLTYKDFHASLCPKAYATIHLDQISKELCPKLHQFVVFSSVSCGRGNAGQTNYGMSNSIMERICERRKAEGFPALAVQWGAIGDVGLVAEMQKESTEIAIGGTLQQRIASCLDVLDKFLNQNKPVVSSIIVAEKFRSNKADNLFDTMLAMLGISDIRSISMHATLPELGMDSMTATEIKQTLERDFDIFLSANEMRTLTFNKLSKIYESEKNKLTQVEEVNFGLEVLLNLNKFDENTYHKKIIEVTSNKDTSKLVLFIPGIDGTYVRLESLINSIKYLSTCLQYNSQGQVEKIDDVIKFYYPIVKDVIKGNKSFYIVAYSFGGVLALEIVSKLEKEGYVGKLVLIDSSWEYSLKLLSVFSKNFDAEFEDKLILKLLENYLPPQKLSDVAEKLRKAKTTDERTTILRNVNSDDQSVLKDILVEYALRIFSTLLAFSKYKFSSGAKLKSKVLLCRAKVAAIKKIPDDYCLSNYVENLEKATFEGDHISILENAEMINAINMFLDS